MTKDELILLQRLLQKFRNSYDLRSEIKDALVLIGNGLIDIIMKIS